MIFAWKINKVFEFYTIFARKMPEFSLTIARKIFFPDFFFWGGGHVPLPLPSPTVSYAYAVLGGWPCEQDAEEAELSVDGQGDEQRNAAAGERNSRRRHIPLYQRRLSEQEPIERDPDDAIEHPRGDHFRCFTHRLPSVVTHQDKFVLVLSK